MKSIKVVEGEDIEGEERGTLYSPHVYCRPGQYYENGVETGDNDAPNRTYKRVLPREQVHRFMVLRSKYLNSNTTEPSMVSYYTQNKEGAKSVGEISFDIPKDKRNIPPDLSPYWLEVRDQTGLYGESSVYNPSVEESEYHYGVEERESKHNMKPTAAVPLKEMEGRSIPEERRKPLEKLEKERLLEKLAKLDINKIATTYLEKPKNGRNAANPGLSKNVISEIISSNKVEEYLGYLVFDDKRNKWKIVGNALANVMKEKYPKMEPVPVYDSKNEQEYLATAYKFEFGKDGTPEEKDDWAENLLQSVRKAVDYSMFNIFEKVKSNFKKQFPEEFTN